MSDETSSLAKTATIVAAFVGRNQIAIAELPGLIGQVHAALTGAQRDETEPAAEKQKPAVSIRKSITQDHLISLEDGRPYKSLKRHLRTKHNLSPEEYRTKWGLPKDYPMVAPNYSASRSALAKALGLGLAKAPAKTPKRRAKTT